MSEFKFKVYEKVPADDHISFRLMDQHEDPKTTITEDQLKDLRSGEEDNTTEKQLESRRTGAADKVTEFNLNKTKGSFGVKHRNEATFTGNINKLEEQRISGKKTEDQKYEEASATPKKLRWWEIKNSDNLKIAANTLVPNEDILDDKRSQSQWDHAYADDSDRMEREEEDALNGTYEDTDDGELLENNDPAYKTTAQLEVEDEEAGDDEDITAEEVVGNIKVAFDNVDVGGTKVKIGKITLDNYNGNKEDTIKEAISFANRQYPELQLTESNIDDANIDNGEIKFATSGEKNIADKTASNDFDVVIISSKKK